MLLWVAIWELLLVTSHCRIDSRLRSCASIFGCGFWPKLHLFTAKQVFVPQSVVLLWHYLNALLHVLLWSCIVFQLPEWLYFKIFNTIQAVLTTPYIGRFSPWTSKKTFFSAWKNSSRLIWKDYEYFEMRNIMVSGIGFILWRLTLRIRICSHILA